MSGNSGISIGGDNSGDFTNVNVGGGQQIIQGPAGIRVVLLKQVDDLIDKLVREGFDQLPAEQAGVVVQEAKTLKGLAHEEAPDRGRVRRALEAIGSAAAGAAPVIEIARQLTDLLTRLPH